MFDVKHKEFGVSELSEVNVESIANCAGGEKDGENLEIEIL